MNLKKIIKEEIDDFSWIEETNPIKIEPMTMYYTLESFHRDRDEDIWSFLKYIEKYSPKSRWFFDGGKPTKLLNKTGIRVIFIHEHEGMSISYNIDSIDNPNFDDYKKVDITGFRKNNFIKEEIDDWGWVDDIPGKEGYGYDINNPTVGMKFRIMDIDTIYEITSMKDHGPYGKTMRISYWDDKKNREEELRWDMSSYNWYHYRNQIHLVQDNFIREGSEDFDWIRNTEPIDLDREVKRYTDKGFVVALWFGNISDDLREHINKFIIKEGFDWGSNRVQTAWTYGNLVMGLTFYPNMSMGGFDGVNARDDWEFYNREVKNGQYEDINPYKFHSVELDRM